MARFAFVEKALAQGIHGDAVGVAVAIGLVADLDVGKSRVDRRRMRALPMARGFGAQVDRHHQHFAGVMLAAAHLHQIGVGAEIARALFGARLESAGAQDHRVGANFILFVGIGDAHALDSPVVAEQRRDPRLVAQLDAHLGRDLAPLHELIQAALNAAARMDHHARFEVIFAVDDHIAVDVPFDADFAHPVNRRGGLRHQDLGQVLC